MASTGSGRNHRHSIPTSLETVDEVVQKPWVDEYEAIGFDDILEAINPQGRFQKRYLYGLLSPIAILLALCYTDVFMLYIPEHWCHDPNWQDYNYTSYEEWKNNTIPKEIDANGVESFSKCNIYLNPNDPDRNATYCPFKWEYDRSEMTLTIPSEFDWVCDRQKYTTYVFTVAGIAGIFGTLISGPAVDKFGRKRMFLINMVIFQIISIVKLFLPGHYVIFLIVIAINCLITARAPLMILFELCDSEFRSWTSATEFVAFVIGISAVPAISYLLADWFYIGIVTAVPRAIIMAILLYMFYIPESPRWLTSVGRLDEAKTIIQRIAKVNGTSNKLTDAELEASLQGLLDAQNKEPSQSGFTGFWTIVSKPRLAKNAILLAMSLASSTFVYSGITLNSPYMPGSQFVTFFILSIIELPSSIAGGYLMQVLGRRWTPVIFLALSAITCLSATWNIDSVVIVTLCIVASKFAVNLSILVSEVQVIELFPTPLRATGGSFVSLIVQVLGISMPSIVNMGRDDARVPYFAFGICSIIGMLCSMFLPETLDQSLPESVAAANDFGKDHPFWSIHPKRVFKRRKFVPVSSIRRMHSTRGGPGSVRSATGRRDSSVVTFVSQVRPTVTRARSRSIIALGAGL